MWIIKIIVTLFTKQKTSQTWLARVLSQHDFLKFGKRVYLMSHINVPYFLKILFFLNFGGKKMPFVLLLSRTIRKHFTC